MRLRLRYLAVPAVAAAAVAANLPEDCGQRTYFGLASCAMVVEVDGATLWPLELRRAIPDRLIGRRMPATQPSCPTFVTDDCQTDTPPARDTATETDVRRIHGLPGSAVLAWPDYPDPLHEAVLLPLDGKKWVMSEPTRRFLNRFLEHPIPREAVARPR